MVDYQLVELVLLCLAFALWGSVAKTLADNLPRRRRGWSFFWLLVTNAVISSFCGLLSLPLALTLQLDRFWVVGIAGLAGWMGIEFLEIAEDKILRKVGLKDDRKPD